MRFLAKILDEGRLLLGPGHANRAPFDRREEPFHLGAASVGGDTGYGMAIAGDDPDRLAARRYDLVEDLENGVTGVRDGDFAQRETRNLRRRFGLPLLASLRVEQSRVLDCNRRLTRDEHDQVEIVRVVRVRLV